MTNGMQHNARNRRPATPRALQELAETVQRSRLGGPFYVFAWIMAGYASGLPMVAPWTFSLVALGFVALTLARFQARSEMPGAGAVDVDRRLRRIWAIVLITSALWGAAS